MRILAADYSFTDLLNFDTTGDDQFVARSATYPWGRVYGGQVAAQALWAAGQTVDEARLPHSIHLYFIRGGVSDQPITLNVERTRDGRSFTTRRVTAEQPDSRTGEMRTIMSMTASFHIPEPEEAMLITPSSSSPPPIDGVSPEWAPFYERRGLDRGVGMTSTWGRSRTELTSSALMRACWLTWMSDDVPTEAVMVLHPVFRDRHMQINTMDELDEDDHRGWMSASLDHAVWFHRELPEPSAWQLHHFTSEVLGFGRGLAQGRVFNTDGQLTATVMQEIVIRELR